MVDALVVNTRRRGPGQMLGLDDSILDRVTGGEFGKVQQQLDRLELALQVAIVASVLSGVAAVALLIRKR